MSAGLEYTYWVRPDGMVAMRFSSTESDYQPEGFVEVNREDYEAAMSEINRLGQEALAKARQEERKAKIDALVKAGIPKAAAEILVEGGA